MFWNLTNRVLNAKFGYLSAYLKAGLWSINDGHMHLRIWKPGTLISKMPSYQIAVTKIHFNNCIPIAQCKHLRWSQ